MVRLDIPKVLAEFTEGEIVPSTSCDLLLKPLVMPARLSPELVIRYCIPWQQVQAEGIRV